MSGGLAPSKSTVYVSNLPFSLTNNDLHKIFEKHGRVAKVTVMRNPKTHQSKGVAFVMFLERDPAHKCCRAMNNTEMFGRTIKCSIAKDNGRTEEFIKRKEYKDKSRCYECGEEGHLSYNCPKNLLGDREQPEKKRKRGKGKEDPEARFEEDEEDKEDEEDEGEDLRQDSLAAAIQYQHQKVKESEVFAASSSFTLPPEPRRKRYKKDAYFSDEEDLGED